MKLIPTFCDGNFHGFETMKEINRLKKEAHELAMHKQEEENADHMIYGFYEYDKDGNLDTVRLYSGISKTDADFDRIAELRNAHIYAIHAKR